MQNASLLTKILLPDGSIKWIHDASSLHGITPATGDNASTWVLQWGDPESGFDSTSSLKLPAGVALKSDISQVLKYAGSISSSASLIKNVSIGNVYVANTSFSYVATQAAPGTSAEPGDMFVRNTCTGDTGPWYDVIQTNIDPTKYAAKDHQHTVSVSGAVSTESFKPTGTISVAVAGASTTFSGSFTPAGNVTVGTFSFTSTNGTVTNGMSLSAGGSHSHSFNGTAAVITVSYDKANANTGNTKPTVSGSITTSFTPSGDISATLSSSSANVVLTGVTVSAITPTFTGTKGTVSTEYTPTGTISSPSINVTLSSSSQKLVNGRTLTTKSHTSKLAINTATYESETLKLTSASFVQYTSDSSIYVTGVTLTSTSYTHITGVSAALASAPTFFGAASTLSAEYTPAGTISEIKNQTLKGNATYTKATGVNAVFTGDAINPTITFTLSAANHSHSIGTTATDATGSYTPAGTIGSAGSHSHSFNGTITVKYDKLSSAQGKFTGTTGTVTVSGTPQLGTPSATFYGETVSHNHTFSTTSTTSKEFVQ